MKDIDGKVFWPLSIIIVVISLYMFSDPQGATAITTAAFNFVVLKFDWLFLLVGASSFLFLGYVAFTKYGNIKLGDPNDKPEFSTFNWGGMLFTAGLGIGILFWGVNEWANFAISPPMGVEPNTPEALTWATSYNMFHWGPTAWALYTIPTIPIAYTFFIRKKPVIRMSEACRPLLGKYTDSLLGSVIDLLVLFGAIAGTVAALGIGTPLVAQAINYLTGIPVTMGLNIGIAIFWALIFSVSVYLGLTRGLAKLSSINVYLVIGVMAFILVLGPTFYIIDVTLNGVGNMFQNYVRMSTWTAPFIDSMFPQWWTVFYWAWWLAIGPFMGLWVTRISRGRTLKQVILGEITFGSAGCFMIHGILGGFSLFQDINGIVPVREIISSGVTYAGQIAVVETIASLPLGGIVLAVFTITGLIFMATTLDSVAYTCAMVCTKDLRGINMEPARWHRTFWAILCGLITVALVYLVGLGPLQSMCVTSALPLVFVFGLMVMAFMKCVKEDFGHMSAETISSGRYKLNNGKISEIVSPQMEAFQAYIASTASTKETEND
ncbi:MAG: BCCT family transporter [Dehalobacterium sp.]